LDVRRFRDDIYRLSAKACAGDDPEVTAKVRKVADVLVGLYRKNVVKINHSALELVCARELVRRGYEVEVEHRVDRALVCDVYGERGDESLIVEIETGFIPPDAAVEPSAYARGRIASKIARYSGFADRFALGTTPTYVLDFPRFFAEPARERSTVEAARIKAATDVRYDRPPISMEELMVARLHSIFLIDVDSGETMEVDPLGYLEGASKFVGSQGLNRVSGARERGFKFAESARQGLL